MPISAVTPAYEPPAGAAVAPASLGAGAAPEPPELTPAVEELPAATVEELAPAAPAPGTPSSPQLLPAAATPALPGQPYGLPPVVTAAIAEAITASDEHLNAQMARMLAWTREATPGITWEFYYSGDFMNAAASAAAVIINWPAPLPDCFYSLITYDVYFDNFPPISSKLMSLSLSGNAPSSGDWGLKFLDLRDALIDRAGMTLSFDQWNIDLSSPNDVLIAEAGFDLKEAGLYINLWPTPIFDSSYWTPSDVDTLPHVVGGEHQDPGYTWNSLSDLAAAFPNIGSSTTPIGAINATFFKSQVYYQLI